MTTYPKANPGEARYVEIVEAASGRCIEGEVEILDIEPEVNLAYPYAKSSGYWVQAWIYVEGN